jgi:alpha-acetolactate decarboxylase
MSQFQRPFRTFLVIFFALGFSTLSVAADHADSHSNKSAIAHAKTKEGFPFDVAVYGNFKHMMHTGDYSPKVKLGDVPVGDGVFAVGALSGLRGEITVINGKFYISLGSPTSSRLMQDEVNNEEASLLVAAKVTQWKKIIVPKDMTQADFEAFVIESAKKDGLDISKPFPFVLNGDISDYKVHVLAAPNPDGAGHGSKGAGAIQYNSSGNSIKGQLVGFYSGSELSGVISHPGELFHVHMVDAKETISAHVDSYGTLQQSVLLIPVLGANASRQEIVAARGAEVMPFSLDATTHVFRKTKNGGTQQVIAKSTSNVEQIRLIREHLREIEKHFAGGNFSSPAAIHGDAMPGLSVLKQAKPGEIRVRYRELSNGAELQFSSNKLSLIDALHQWFDAQLSDHGKDAMAGHEHHH